jgi:hypothetical protein
MKVLNFRLEIEPSKNVRVRELSYNTIFNNFLSDCNTTMDRIKEHVDIPIEIIVKKSIKIEANSRFIRDKFIIVVIGSPSTLFRIENRDRLIEFIELFSEELDKRGHKVINRIVFEEELI